jgi:ribosomal protein S18 acetylase RimI-like enzyme
MDEITISPAKPEDAEGIVHVRRTTWLATYPNEVLGITRQDIEEALNTRSDEQEVARIANHIKTSTGTHTWVSKVEGKVVGFLRFEEEDKRNRIHALYILPEYQHQGIGKALTQLVLDRLGTLKEIYLEVAAYNQSAINFYKKLGFIENGPTTNEVAQLPSGKVIPEIEMIKRVTLN